MIAHQSKLDFICNHVSLFKASGMKHNYVGIRNETQKQIADLARLELGYSKKTSSCDILMTLSSYI